MAHQNVKNDKKQKKFFLCPMKPITKAFEGTAAGVYDFRRLKTGRCGGLWGKALLAPGFLPELLDLCLNRMVSTGFCTGPAVPVSFPEKS